MIWNRIKFDERCKKELYIQKLQNIAEENYRWSK